MRLLTALVKILEECEDVLVSQQVLLDALYREIEELRKETLGYLVANTVVIDASEQVEKQRAQSTANHQFELGQELLLL